MAWKDLSIRDKAAVIRDAIAGGNFNLSSIRNKFDDGGPIWGNFMFKPDNSDIDNYVDNVESEEKTWAEQYPHIQYMEDMNRKYQDIRRDTDEKYSIPFIPDKRIILTGAGKSTGAEISTNVLDSLAKYGAATNMHPYDAIGLPSRETQLGLYPGPFLHVEEGYPERLRYHGQNQLKEKGFVTPVELTNDDRYYSTPYNDAIGYGARKSGASTSVAGDSRVYYESHPATDSIMNEYMGRGRAYADRLASKINWTEHPLIHAFNLFKSGKYNTGEPNHTQYVRGFGKDVFNSPEVQKWWNDGGKNWYKGTEYANFHGLGDWLTRAWYNINVKPKVEQLGVDEVRKRLYNNISPWSYVDPPKRIKSALNNEMPDFERFQEKHLRPEERFKRDDIFAEYLQIPKEERRKLSESAKVRDSKYSPSIHNNENIEYKSIPLQWYEEESLVNSVLQDNKDISEYFIKKGRSPLFYNYKKGSPQLYEPLKIGQSRVSHKLGSYFGPHTISVGVDPQKGEYVSYYDLWDISPSKGNGEDESFGIGKPIEFYDRIYLNDYFGVYDAPASDSYYGGWIPESMVVAETTEK